MRHHHGRMVLVDDNLYRFNDAILYCLELATGKMMWRDRSVGKGLVTFEGSELHIQSEDNIAKLAEASPFGTGEGTPRDSRQGAPSWAHFVISGGRL
jgi:hypothetical protein